MTRPLLVLIFFLVISASSFAQQSKPLLFREEIYEFGIVKEDNGPVVHEFLFTNNSGRAVKILGVQASCGCTTPGWSKDVVPAGKTGFIQASFNPKGRPGYFSKTLTVNTDLNSDPIVLQIKGSVDVDNKTTNDTEFQVANGNLKLRTSSFNMGKVFIKDEFTTKEFQVYNSSAKPIVITGKTAGPDFIKVEVSPTTIAPGSKASLKISYNGKMKNRYGFQSDNIEITTDDEEKPVKSFTIYATLEDYFATLPADELAKAPHLRVSDYNLDFGRVKQNSAISREIAFTNTGKKELSLRALEGNCTCVSASASKTSLKAGESSVIKITFSPKDRTGTQSKAVTLYSNDPQNPVQRISFTSYVEE